jgi:hypothetical protein
LKLFQLFIKLIMLHENLINKNSEAILNGQIKRAEVPLMQCIEITYNSAY